LIETQTHSSLEYTPFDYGVGEGGQGGGEGENLGV